MQREFQAMGREHGAGSPGGCPSSGASARGCYAQVPTGFRRYLHRRKTWSFLSPIRLCLLASD
jgi:hypothetical protein